MNNEVYMLRNLSAEMIDNDDLDGDLNYSDEEDNVVQRVFNKK